MSSILQCQNPWRALVLPFLLASGNGLALAEPATICDAGNLLAGRLPVMARIGSGDLTVVTDGTVAAEGAVWDSAPALVLEDPSSTLIWDLGTNVEIRAVVLQADANDRYALWASLDGLEFEPLGQIGELPDRHGLHTRTLSLAARQVRFLRLSPSHGDGLYSISEVQAFCTTPQPWPPQLPVVAAPLAQSPRTARWWNDTSSRWWELILALAGLALLAWDRGLASQQGSVAARRWRDRLLAIAGVVAAATYFNFGAFHFGNYVHGWDTFHYYIGAKYFRELGYEQLYECVAIADAEEPGLRPRVETRKITDLRTNVLGSTEDILAQPERCTSRFSATRWREFQHDVAWFRDRENPSRWERVSTDHGYNATPVWNLAGSLLANTAPASDRQILLLTLLDPAYFLALIAVVGWAFGWRALAVALLVFSTFFPCRFFWTGGAFLRWDWLFYTVSSVACLRRGRPLLGGLALGYAALLRIFPGFLAIGSVTAIAVHAGRRWRRRSATEARGNPFGIAALRTEPARSHVRFLAGAIVAAALLLPASLVAAGDASAYRDFVVNSLKHSRTPLTNNMGLRTVLTWRPDEIGRRLHDDGAADPWGAWKEARLRAWKRGRLVAVALALFFLGVLGAATWRHPEPWITAALGVMFVAWAAELTSYYYAFILVPALLWTRRTVVGILLLLLSSFSTFVSLAPLPGMSTWRDEQYTLISLATVIAFAAILMLFAVDRSERPLPNRGRAGRSANELADSPRPTRRRSGSRRRQR